VKEIISSLPYFPEESIPLIMNDIESTLRSGRLTDGPNVQRFEKNFTQYHNMNNAVCLSSCSASLEIALRFFNVKDKEVIVPTNTFISTPNAVVHSGGKPVFADMQADTLCIDPADLARKVTSKTAGVIVVHIAGLVSPDIRELQQFCKDNNLFMIEDCAHAHGATFEGQKAGTFGDAGCFSFYPTKVMTSGEGGMLLTNNSSLAEEAKFRRSYGQDQQKLMVVLGHNWRLSEVGAVIGYYQLQNLEAFLVKRNQIAEQYRKNLKAVTGVSLFPLPSNVRHSYYKFPIRLDDSIDRLKLALVMKDKYGIETGHVYYPPCHLHPYYQKTFGTGPGDFPIAESVLKQTMCLPLHCGLTGQDVDYVIDALISSLKQIKLGAPLFAQ
jgi:perosamine synthetase